VSPGSSEHEPEGELLGQRLCRIDFQDLEAGLETVDGKHSAEEVRSSVFMYVEAYYNRIRRTLVRCIRYLTMLPLMCLPMGKSLNSVYPMR
jgi:hypothetical protein